MAPSTEEFFKQNGYAVYPDILTQDEVAHFLDLFDRDRSDFERVWSHFGNQIINCDSLLTTPEFDEVIRHPQILGEIESLMGGPVCFGELCIRHMGPHETDAPKRGWHRDKLHWHEHPLRMDYIQLMLYLTDVNEETHCFSISPESLDSEILDKDPQLERGGIHDLHGPPGTVVLFNVSVLHTATVRNTKAERKTIQAYYGHPSRTYLSNCTVIPESLGQDNADPAARAFYSKLNRKTRRYLEARTEGKLPDQESILDWCRDYDKNIKSGDNKAREGEEDDVPAAGGQEHGSMGE